MFNTRGGLVNWGGSDVPEELVNREVSLSREVLRVPQVSIQGLSEEYE